MTRYNMEVVPGTRAPVLPAALLSQVHELNRDYVELLLAGRLLPAPGMSGETLPTRIIEGLADLDAEARTALSGCAYTLYSPGFDDRRFWQTVLSPADLSQVAEAEEGVAEKRYGTRGPTSMQAAFSEVALFAAWHAAASHTMAARFLFGMPDETAAIFNSAPLWQIRRVAFDYPGLLTPRWPLNPAFWPDLIRFAAAGDAVKLEAAQLLGSQLIAAELHGERQLRPRSRLGAHRREV